MSNPQSAIRPPESSLLLNGRSPQSPVPLGLLTDDERELDRRFAKRKNVGADRDMFQVIPPGQRLTVGGLARECGSCGSLTRNGGPCAGVERASRSCEHGQDARATRPLCHSDYGDMDGEITVKGDLAARYCRHCAKFGAEGRESGACPDLLTAATGDAVWDLEDEITGCYVRAAVETAVKGVA